MLSKLVQRQLKTLSHKSVQTATGLRKAFFDVVYKDDKSDAHYIATQTDPRRPLQSHRGKDRAFAERSVQTTKLANGITVVTENAAFPTTVDFGVLLDVGTRDETTETSGSLQSIQNTYLKTVLNTNETINYGIVQMSGGKFEVEFDQEQTYFYATALAHDGVDVFNMVADCALEPRSFTAAQVGQSQNENTHKLDQYLKTGEAFNEAVFQTAYGVRGLGLPLKGLKGNIQNLTSYTLQKFQLENITPDRIYVAAAGVESHQEFLDLAGDKLGNIPSTVGKTTNKRDASQWVGGEVRNLSEDSTVTLGLYFQGANWQSGDLWALQVANTILNQARIQNLLSTKHYIDSGAATNTHFTDSGLFGVRLTGSASNGKQILDDATSEIKRLADGVSSSEVEQAKSALKIRLLAALERQTDRLEETVKSIRTYGKVRTNEYLAAIDNVTSDQVRNAVGNVLKNTNSPTFVAWGGDVNRLPSYDAISNSFK